MHATATQLQTYELPPRLPQCWNNQCTRESLQTHATCAVASGLMPAGAASSDLPNAAGSRRANATAGCVAAGKSGGEVREAVLAWRWMQVS